MLQDEAPAFEKYPAAHCWHRSCGAPGSSGAELPALQGMHPDVLPGAEYVPPRHTAQAVRLPFAAVPLPQATHASAPLAFAEAYTGQAGQTAAPTAPDAVPGEQGRQRGEPAGAHCPGPHATHPVYGATLV